MTDKDGYSQNRQRNARSINAGSNERRKLPRQSDLLYQIMLGLNLVCWVSLLGALILFHYARPELVTGLQDYWGLERRDFWSPSHLEDLVTLLQVSLSLSIVTIVLRSRRNRRKEDRFGVNIIILLVISVTSLVTLYLTV